MMIHDALFREVEQTRIAWNALYEQFANAQYDVDAGRPCIENQSLTTLHKRATLVFELFAAFRPNDANDANWLPVVGFAGNLESEFRGLRAAFQPVVDQLAEHSREGTTIGDASGNFALQLFAAGKNFANFDVSAPFFQVHNQLLHLQGRAGQILPLVKAVGVADLSARATAIAELAREVGKHRDSARTSSEGAAASSGVAADHLKSVQEALTQGQTIVSALQALQSQADTNAGNVTALVEKIKTVGANADSLDQQVSAYQAKFDAFQKQLDDRSAQFTKFETDSVTAAEKNREREAEITRLSKQADAMISGATTAGLAKSMEDARRRYEDRMKGARMGFFVSIALLVVSAMPLAAHLLPGLFVSWLPVGAGATENSPYPTLGKFLLLVPASWLTAFFTKSYADFFHLEREYAHKAALAMSIDGFKRQAPKFEEEITAEVFLEIRKNLRASPVRKQLDIRSTMPSGMCSSAC